MALFPLLQCAQTINAQNEVVRICEFGDFMDLLQRVITILLAFGGGVAVLMALWAAYLFITSTGNEERATAARKTLWWALIGMLVIIFSYALVYAVFRFIIGDETAPIPTL